MQVALSPESLFKDLSISAEYGIILYRYLVAWMEVFVLLLRRMWEEVGSF